MFSINKGKNLELNDQWKLEMKSSKRVSFLSQVKNSKARKRSQCNLLFPLFFQYLTPFKQDIIWFQLPNHWYETWTIITPCLMKWKINNEFVQCRLPQKYTSSLSGNFIRSPTSWKSSLLEQISWEWSSITERASTARRIKSRIEYLKLWDIVYHIHYMPGCILIWKMKGEENYTAIYIYIYI